MTLRAAFALVIVGSILSACQDKPGKESRTPRPAPPASTAEKEDVGLAEAQSAEADPERRAYLDEQREGLVETLAAEGIESEPVLAAIGEVPRHELIPDGLWNMAYANRPLPIGEGQTISQPYIVALMTQLAGVDRGDKVLEVGTGSGYQAAVLSEMGAEVYTIEIVEPLGNKARRDLERLGYADDIHFRIGDGYAGWPQAAPFDAIVVTAAPPKIPEPLKEQLKTGGRMVIPVGEQHQELMLLEKTEDGLREREVIPVRFVPMTGEAQR